MYSWHRQSYQQLTEAFEQGRGHHALLFKTDNGLGTESLIEAIAHSLLCQNKQGNMPCGQCKSCVLYRSGSHPDFHLIEPIENRDIGVDQIRELTATLQQFSPQGGNSVAYIRGAERLTESAANALLKTLEEPHNGVYFLLQVPLQGKIAATIQSRCQTWLIQPPALSEALAWLQAEFPALPVSDLEITLRINHQRPLASKHFLENDRLQVRKSFLQTFWRFFKRREVWLLLTAFGKEKEDVLQQLEWLDSFFADSLKAKMGIATGWLNPDLINGIMPFAETLSNEKLLKGHQILSQTQRDLKEVNAVNQELMLANCLTKLVLDVFE